MRAMRMGVQRPSIPASKNAGWSALFGHTFMHSAQRMQRSRNARSSTAPGGRMTFGVVVDVERVGDARGGQEAARPRRPPRAPCGAASPASMTALRRFGRNVNLIDVLRAGRLAVHAHVALVLPPLHAALRASRRPGSARGRGCSRCTWRGPSPCRRARSARRRRGTRRAGRGRGTRTAG